MTTETTCDPEFKAEIAYPTQRAEAVEELAKIFVDCGASESQARESAWKMAEAVSKAVEREIMR